MKSLAFCLGIFFAIARVDSHLWDTLTGRYIQSGLQILKNPPFNQPRTTTTTTTTTHPPPEYEIFKGSLDQLNQINAQWICTNQRTGDMIVIGSDNGNPGNHIDPRQNQYPDYPDNQVYPQQPQPHVPQQPQPHVPQPQVPENRQPQVPENPRVQKPHDQGQHHQNQGQQPHDQGQQTHNQGQQQQKHDQSKNTGFPELPWTILPGKGGSTEAPAVITTEDPSRNIDWTSYISTSPPTVSSMRDDETHGIGIIQPRIGK